MIKNISCEQHLHLYTSYNCDFIIFFLDEYIYITIDNLDISGRGSCPENISDVLLKPYYQNIFSMLVFYLNFQLWHIICFLLIFYTRYFFLAYFFQLAIILVQSFAFNTLVDSGSSLSYTCYASLLRYCINGLYA